jgi:hypothetical protein
MVAGGALLLSFQNFEHPSADNEAPAWINSVSVPEWAPLYPSTNGRGISFANGAGSDGTVSAFNDKRELIWAKPLGEGRIMSGFDLNADGTTDFALLKTSPSGTKCAATEQMRRRIEFYSGVSGKLLASTSPISDRCVKARAGSWIMPMLQERALQFGSVGGLLALIPKSSGQGWFYEHAGDDSFKSFGIYTPGAGAFGSYAKGVAVAPKRAIASIQAAGPSEGPNGLHGLFVKVREGEKSSSRFVAFGDGRVLQYALGDLNKMQLVSDREYAGGARALNGMIVADPMLAERVFVIEGMSVQGMYSALADAGVAASSAGASAKTSESKNSPGARILSYNAGTHEIQTDSVVGEAIAYPATALLPSREGSRLLYNVRRDGTWYMTMTAPGRLESASTLKNMFVWDAIPREGGEYDLLMSPVASGAATPGWETRVYRWTPGKKELALLKTVTGAVPYLKVPFSNQPGSASTDGYQLRSMRALDRADKTQAVLVMRKEGGAVSPVRMDW